MSAPAGWGADSAIMRVNCNSALNAHGSCPLPFRHCGPGFFARCQHFSGPICLAYDSRAHKSKSQLHAHGLTNTNGYLRSRLRIPRRLHCRACVLQSNLRPDPTPPPDRNNEWRHHLGSHRFWVSALVTLGSGTVVAPCAAFRC